VALAPAREKPRGRRAAAPPAAGDAGLFEALRELRLRLARERGVPPYVIFADAALRAMAEQRPRSADDFARIPGVGARKLEQYAEVFTGLIRAHGLAEGAPGKGLGGSPS
jgi:ATP-dependent DNA helicase RecQ